ncbi:MAG: acyl-CoA dehydrogenase [Gammaproteobacteria bacterium]|nr:acyl-CoA dehydrogenase [Gammaproteobacteria bacterium]
MSLLLNEEQTLLKDSAKSFTDENTDLEAMREKRSRSRIAEINKDLWQKIIELGWTAIPFSEEYGGLGLGYAELGIVMEELGRGLVDVPLFSNIVLAGSVIDVAGSQEQKKQLLPKIIDGSTFISLAYQEGARHAPYDVSSALEPDPKGFVLNGKKQLVLDGGSANHLIVVARSSGKKNDRGGLSLVIVDAQQEGVSVKNNLLLDSRRVANIEFRNVIVSTDNVIGGIGESADTLDKIYTRAAVALSAEMLGGAQRAFDITLEYLKVREQFGAKIGSFQGLKHRASRWFCEVELSKSIVLKALRAIDSDDPEQKRLAHACKARTSSTYHLSGIEGVQMHGGIGVTDEHDIGLYMKRARVTELLLGDAAYHADQFAKLSGY